MEVWQKKRRHRMQLGPSMKDTVCLAHFAETFTAYNPLHTYTPSFREVPVLIAGEDGRLESWLLVWMTRTPESGKVTDTEHEYGCKKAAGEILTASS